MTELKEKANCYAEENVINVLKEAFAKVYTDGYRDGYQDCKEDIPSSLRESDVEFIDLGLPSGTLWSSDYKKSEDNREYIPYGQAELMDIPSNEQWEELRNTCKWEFDIDDSYDLCEGRCVGPNGNILRFERTGKQNINKHSEVWEVFFWIKDEKEGNEKAAVHMFNGGKKGRWRNPKTEVQDFFSGYKLPVRLVKIK